MIRPGIFAVNRVARSGVSVVPDATVNPLIAAISAVRSIPAFSSPRDGDR